MVFSPAITPFAFAVLLFISFMQSCSSLYFLCAIMVSCCTVVNLIGAHAAKNIIVKESQLLEGAALNRQSIT